MNSKTILSLKNECIKLRDSILKKNSTKFEAFKNGLIDDRARLSIALEKNNKLKDEFKKPSNHGRLINTIDEMLLISDYQLYVKYGVAHKVHVLNNFLKCLDSNKEGVIENFKELFNTNKSVFQQDGDTVGMNFVKVIGHLLLSALTGGLYPVAAALNSYKERNSAKFWLSDEEVFVDNISDTMTLSSQPT